MLLHSRGPRGFWEFKGVGMYLSLGEIAVAVHWAEMVMALARLERLVSLMSRSRRAAPYYYLSDQLTHRQSWFHWFHLSARIVCLMHVALPTMMVEEGLI